MRKTLIPLELELQMVVRQTKPGSFARAVSTFNHEHSFSAPWKKCLLTNPNSASYWLILEFRSVSRQGFSFTWVKVRQTMKGLLSCWRWPCGAGCLSLLLLPGMGWDLQSSSQTQKDKDSVFFWQRALVWEFIKQKKECELQDRSCGIKV